MAQDPRTEDPRDQDFKDFAKAPSCSEAAGETDVKQVLSNTVSVPD